MVPLAHRGLKFIQFHHDSEVSSGPAVLAVVSAARTSKTTGQVRRSRGGSFLGRGSQRSDGGQCLAAADGWGVVIASTPIPAAGDRRAGTSAAGSGSTGVAFGKPTKIINDAAMQAISSRGGRSSSQASTGSARRSSSKESSATPPRHLPYKRPRSRDHVGRKARRRRGNKRVEGVFDVVQRFANAMEPDHIIARRRRVEHLDSYRRTARASNAPGSVGSASGISRARTRARPARPASHVTAAQVELAIAAPAASDLLAVRDGRQRVADAAITCRNPSAALPPSCSRRSARRRHSPARRPRGTEPRHRPRRGSLG